VRIRKTVEVLTTLSMLSILILAFQNCIETPKAPNSSAMASSSFDHSRVTNEQCMLCHEKDRPLTNPVHGDGADCGTCHLSGEPWTVVGAFNHNPVPKACSTCHGAGKAQDSALSNHPKHIAIESRDCIECHQVAYLILQIG